MLLLVFEFRMDVIYYSRNVRYVPIKQELSTIKIIRALLRAFQVHQKTFVHNKVVKMGHTIIIDFVPNNDTGGEENLQVVDLLPLDV